jgi:hypothetical protein
MSFSKKENVRDWIIRNNSPKDSINVNKKQDLIKLRILLKFLASRYNRNE